MNCPSLCCPHKLGQFKPVPYKKRDGKPVPYAENRKGWGWSDVQKGRILNAKTDRILSRKWCKRMRSVYYKVAANG